MLLNLIALTLAFSAFDTVVEEKSGKNFSLNLHRRGNIAKEKKN